MSVKKEKTDSFKKLVQNNMPKAVFFGLAHDTIGLRNWGFFSRENNPTKMGNPESHHVTHKVTRDK